MTVTGDENKVENVAPQEKSDVISTQNQIDTKSQQKQQENKEDSQQEDPNWRAFREARKKDRQEREAAERKAAEREQEIAALKAAMEAAFSKNNQNFSNFQTYTYAPAPEYEETEDEKIEKKVQAAIAAKEAQYEKERMEREHQEYPRRLQQSYPDFNGTISQENLDYLDYHYPEVSRPLQRLRDGYDKWSDIYLAIKKFVPNNLTAKKEAAKADANFSKPKSISSSSISQTGEVLSAARLSEERKAANWARMQQTLKGVG